MYINIHFISERKKLHKQITNLFSIKPLTLMSHDSTLQKS